ncbi:MAG: hypothetical protein HYY16_18640 [Planctomycetes bacterium]|nr:hypothetical protein [Planctomycetota bacterium]
MARARDLRLARLRRVRRRLSERMLQAEREGRLDEMLRQMDKRARRWLVQGQGEAKPRRRAAE